MTPNEYDQIEGLRRQDSIEVLGVVTEKAARQSERLEPRCARARLTSERSTPVYVAPCLAKFTASVPIPHPISSTRLPDQRPN